MGLYYHFDSEGEGTNLQLFSFRHARKLWRELESDYERLGEKIKDLNERCVLVLTTLGLSVSQLLGQNNPNNLRFPIEIFNDFAARESLDQEMTEQFKEFNTVYNDCRHFGPDKYETVDGLTFEVTKQYFQFGLKVWREVCHKSLDETDFKDFEEGVLDSATDAAP